MNVVVYERKELAKYLYTWNPALYKLYNILYYYIYIEYPRRVEAHIYVMYKSQRDD